MRNFIVKDSKGKKLKNPYYIQKRDNKQTLGFRKHYGNSTCKDSILKLIVYGNFDVLHKTMFGNITLINKEHAIDKGYFKKVYVLSDAGKRKLKKYRQNKTL